MSITFAPVGSGWFERLELLSADIFVAQEGLVEPVVACLSDGDAIAELFSADRERTDGLLNDN